MHAQETFWFCKNLILTNIKTQNADYIFLNNNNAVIDNIELFAKFKKPYLNIKYLIVWSQKVDTIIW